MKKTKIAKALLPFMFLGSPAFAGGSSVRSASRFKLKKAVVQQHEVLKEKERDKNSFQDPFASFGNTKNIKRNTVNTKNVLEFLKKENLLKYEKDKDTLISGDIENRKLFAKTACQSTFTWSGAPVNSTSISLTTVQAYYNGNRALKNGKAIEFATTTDTGIAFMDRCRNGVSDSTAPTLSSQSSSNIAETTATIQATSDEAGTMYYVITTSSTVPSNTQVSEGKDNTGAAATKSGNDACTTSAESFNITGLSENTQYYYYIVVKDAADNISSVVSGNFATLSSNTAPTVDLDGDDSTGGSSGGAIRRLYLAKSFKSAINKPFYKYKDLSNNTKCA